MGPFLTSKGCKYILVLIDAATRFCWLQAMSEITAAGVAREMLHVFSEFGWPSTLVMDGGSNMSKAAVTNILALVGAEARVTIPGAHEQNSAVERMIQEVRQAIKKKCDKHPKEWKSFLPVIQMEINEYEISKIHDVRTGENGQEYLVKWKGYKECTWEAKENMEGAGRALELFWDRKEKEDEVRRKPWSTSHEVRPTRK